MNIIQRKHENADSINILHRQSNFLAQQLLEQQGCEAKRERDPFEEIWKVIIKAASEVIILGDVEPELEADLNKAVAPLAMMILDDYGYYIDTELAKHLSG